MVTWNPVKRSTAFCPNPRHPHLNNKPCLAGLFTGQIPQQLYDCLGQLRANNSL